MRSRTSVIAAFFVHFALGCEEPAPADSPPDRPATPEVDAPAGRAVPAGLLAPDALAAALPVHLVGFASSGEIEPHVERGLVPTTRAALRYAEGERSAQLRIVDASRAPDLVRGFAAAQQIPMEPTELGEELVPTGVAGRPALASWSPQARISEAQMVVAERFIVAVTVTPARVPEEAVELLEALPLAPIEALAR